MTKLVRFGDYVFHNSTIFSIYLLLNEPAAIKIIVSGGARVIIRRYIYSVNIF